jgi:ABC-type glycerol-3-phosphate transport system substrate-binding protein
MKRTLLVLVVALCVLAVGPIWAAETKITVPTALGWVTTNAMVPAVAEELKADNIKVDVVATENIVLRDKQMMEGRMGSGAFDVFLAWEALMPLMTDFLEPLDEHITKAGVDLEAFKKSFYPAVQELISVNGKIYWIPIHVNSQLGYARKDLFTDPKEQAAFKKQYGYDLPQPNAVGSIAFKDRQQFIDVAKFFTRDIDGDGKIDLWGLSQPAKWDHGTCIFEELLFRAGLEYFDAKGHSLWGPAHPENQPIVLDIAKFLYDTINTWKITSPGALGMEMTETNQLFMEGKAAMSYTWNVDFWGKVSKGDFATKYGVPLSWSIGFMNKAPEYKGLMSIWGYSLSKDSKNKDAAVKFLLKMANPELRKKVHATVGLPCPNGQVEVTEWAAKEGYAPGAFIDAVQSVGSFWPVSKTPWVETEPVRDVVRGTREKLLAAQMTPEQFVKETGEKIEAIMKEAGHF